jgi:hypothetical protein
MHRVAPLLLAAFALVASISGSRTVQATRRSIPETGTGSVTLGSDVHLASAAVTWHGSPANEGTSRSRRTIRWEGGPAHGGSSRRYPTAIEYAHRHPNGGTTHSRPAGVHPASTAIRYPTQLP